MKRFIYIITGILLLGIAPACNDLDIPPLNVLQDKDLFNDAGMQAYMAALYSRMPIEDFRYSAEKGFNNARLVLTTHQNTGENANRNTSGFVNAAHGYWDDGYQVIRQSNYLIENLPEYVPSLGQTKVDQWIAEAKFIRAYTYFALVKRYGGVPLTMEVQSLEDGNVEALQIPRNSEQEVYDAIINDLDYVIANMSETSEQKYRVNSNIAAAFKSRVALFAGTIARYGNPYIVDGTMLCGIPATEANDYLKIAFQAAKSIEDKYSLYMKTWSASDKKATADNYANLFLDETSTETIFSKGYQYPDNAHSFDWWCLPPSKTPKGADRFNPTLDYVELFDGLSKNEKGQLKTTDEDGNYIVCENAEEFWENCEPRLRGTVLLPGMAFKEGYVDIRRGTINESIDPSTPIQKFVAEGSTVGYSTNEWYAENVTDASHWYYTLNVTIELSTGDEIYAVGVDGPSRTSMGTTTGFHGRKWLDTNWPSENGRYTNDQSWIDIRYAEILLNRAEAALELHQNGVTILDGVNMQEDAFQCINAIRERAGAELLTSPAELSTNSSIDVDQGVGGYVLAPNRGLQIIRIERRKELAFENKIWWDMLRWRTADSEVNNRLFRSCFPFIFAKGAVPLASDYIQGKFIFDCRFDQRGYRWTIESKHYYEPIPDSELAANPNLIQNEQY